MTSSPSAPVRFESVTPRLPVSDVEATLDFYLHGLGFQLGWKWGSPTTHAHVYRDAVGLDLMVSPPERAGTARAYVQLQGIDPYFAELKSRQVRVGELANRDYGMRDFEVIDPCGNRLAFGEPLSTPPETHGQ